MQNDLGKFLGFPSTMSGNFWMYPRVMDLYWHELSGSEQKVLDFILRRTWGFKKLSDCISLSQFESGGGKLGKGAGVSARQAINALESLQQKGYIAVRKEKGKTNEYSLVVQEVHTSSEKTASSSDASTAQVGSEKTAHTINNYSIEEAIERIYKLYSHYVRTGVKMTQEARVNIKNRFKEYQPGELVAAMKNVREHEYWGDIARTNTVAWFFASEERVATFLALGPFDGQKQK